MQSQEVRAQCKESAKKFAQKVNSVLAANESDIMKLQDVVLFYHPIRAVIIFVVINLIILLLDLGPFPGYTLIFFGLAIGSVFSTFRTLLKPLVALLLPKEILELTDESQDKRYEIAQISAFIGLLYYLCLNFFKQLDWTMKEKQLAPILVYLFILLFAFYLFLSLGDVVSVFILVNLFLLLPYLTQNSVKRLIASAKDTVSNSIPARLKQKFE